MKLLANILAFTSTYIVISMLSLIIVQNTISYLHKGMELTLTQERTTFILCLIFAALLIPFYYFPY